MPTLQDILRWLLNLFWFILVIVIIGQLGVLIELGNAYLGVAGALDGAIAKQATAGNFIVFSSGLVAASMYFIIREYNSSKKAIELRSIKSLLILVAIILFIISALYLNAMPNSYQNHPMAHWLIYWACMAEVFLLWCIDEANSAKSFSDEIDANTEKMTRNAAKAKDDGKGTKL